MKTITKISIFLLIFLAVSTTVFARTPDTYSWAVTQPGYFSWETSNAWTATDLANTGIWPHVSGDVANLFPATTQTQSYGKFMIAITENETIADLYGGITNDGFYIVGVGAPLLVFDDSAKETSSLIITNQRAVLADGSFNDLSVVFFEDTKIILSNDLLIAGVTAPNPSNVTGYTEILLYDTVNLFGNGHDITFHGPGWITPGWYGDTVEIKGVNKFTVYGGFLRMFESPTFDAPLYVKSYYDCNNDLKRGTYAMAGENFDMDLVLSNAYVESWYSNWLRRELGGTMVIRDFVLMDLFDTGTLVWTNNISAAVSGDGVFYKGYDNEDSGVAEFTGSIAPGEGNGNGSLHFLSPRGDRLSFGLPTDRLNLNMDINGMRDYSGIDNDIVLAENISAIDLGNINLNINNEAVSNPYRTNELMHSFDNAFAGTFNSINWNTGSRIGSVIISPQSVLVTGIPPLTNFFDVYADRVILVKGETQQVLIARSPFEMNVNIAADESWISVQSAVSLSNDASVSIPVTVPADQPTTNGYGFSEGTITFSAAADPSVKIEERVFVLEPGYFELNKSKLWIMENLADSHSVRAYSPLTVGVQATVEAGSSWISVSGSSSVYLTNGGKYFYIDTTAQPVGTTGIISFTNINMPTIKHDVPVEVVGPGYFEVTPTTVAFAAGETQKNINVSAPFATDVNINSADPWIAVPTSVSLARNGYSIPVIIPADQVAGSTGTINFVSSCSTNIIHTVKIIVFPSGPDAPLNVSATDGSFPDKVQIEWSENTNATKYKVYRNTFDSSSSSIDISGELSTTNFDDAAASQGQLYYYWVKAGNTNGWSDFSASDSGMKLSAPDILNASDGTFTNKVEIIWNESTGAIKYIVYRSITDNTTTAVNISGEISGTNYNDATATQGQLYYYWVKAGNTNGWSDFGAGDNGYENINSPENINATDGIYPDKINISWSEITNADKYKVFRNTTDNSSAAMDISGDVFVTNFNDTTASSGQLYFYWVKAGNTNGYSDFSESDSGMKLSAPNILNASDGTFTNKVEITWDESVGATKFLVYHSITNNASTAVNISGEIANTNFNDIATLPGQLYYYWIKAGNINGWSDFGASESGYKKWIAPSNVSATDGVYPDKIRVTWSGIDGATKYKVYRNQVDNSSTAADISGEILTMNFDDINAEQRQLYYYWVKAGNASGWSGFSESDSGEVYAFPIADIILPNAPTSGILPFAVNFVGEGIAGGAAITNYHWNFSDKTSVTNGISLTNVFHIFMDEGVFTSRFTVTDAGNYTNSDFVVITVVPEPFYLLFIIYQLLFFNWWKRK